MKYVILPDSARRELPFYLAMEEYVASRINEDVFFIWQVAPTVIFGRNQVVEREVNIDYCQRKGIKFFRRKSGGGCVYADYGNVMFSFVLGGDSAEASFQSFSSRIVEMLRRLGITAEATGRNDIFIDGRKVSGCAFYRLGDRGIVHGTMLYSTDIGNMAQAISPSPDKLKSKGVESVRSHITTISEHSPISLDGFIAHARKSICDDEMVLTARDIAEIERMATPYYAPEWIYGRNPRYSRVVERRIDGVGEFRVEIDVNHGRIAKVDMSGDYFQTGDVAGQLLGRLGGAVYSPAGVADALSGFDAGDVVSGLKTEEFVNLIFDNHE